LTYLVFSIIVIAENMKKHDISYFNQKKKIN
jgi:hypothetical protein